MSQGPDPKAGAASAQPALETTTPLEWLIAAFGGLVVAAALIYLALFAAMEPARTPQVELSVTEVAETPAGYLVTFKAANAGATAAGLQVTGELRRGETVVETSEITLDYLPQHSERRGGLFFSADPADHQLSLRAHGYSEP